MMKRWLLLLPVLVTLVGAADPAPPPANDQAAREGAVRLALETFWSAFLRGDAETLRPTIDLPLTLLEPGTAERGGSRYVVDTNGWSAFRQHFPTVPLMAQEVSFTLEEPRLEWLDPSTCLAVYDLHATVREQETGGRFTTILTWAEGWRVVVTTIPQ